MHYMLHYVSQIERYGPLIHSWTMRHEAKLSFVKRSSRRGNFKNIVKTVVTHHQYWLAYHLKCTDNLLYPIPDLSTKPRVDNFSAQSEHMQAEIMHVLNCTTSDDLTLYHHKWIKLQSTCYKVDDYILLEHDGFLPTFGKVKGVIRGCRRQPLYCFILTSGMLRSSDIYIYIYIYIYNMHSHASTTTHNLYANLYYAKMATFRDEGYLSEV